MDDFATVVKAARLEKGLTLEAVAAKIDSHKGYVSGFENRKVNPPSPKIVRKLSKIFGLDVKRLLILAAVEKAPKEVRDVMREGSLSLYEKLDQGVTIAQAPPAPAGGAKAVAV